MLTYPRNYQHPIQPLNGGVQFRPRTNELPPLFPRPPVILSKSLWFHSFLDDRKQLGEERAKRVVAPSRHGARAGDSECARSFDTGRRVAKGAPLCLWSADYTRGYSFLRQAEGMTAKRSSPERRLEWRLHNDAPVGLRSRRYLVPGRYVCCGSLRAAAVDMAWRSGTPTYASITGRLTSKHAPPPARGRQTTSPP